MAWGPISASVLFVCLVLIARAQDDIREPPRILEPLAAQTQFHKRGSTVVLMCNATGKPNPRYEWYLNDVKLEPSGSDGKTYDPVTGVLTIPDFSVQKEGFFNCRAKNTFPNQLHAVAISPKIELRVGRLEPLNTPNVFRTKTAHEGSYVFIRCDDTLPESVGPTSFQWYDIRGQDQMNIVPQGERVFIDSEGTLHFAYARRSDQLPSNGNYVCAVASVLAEKSELLKRRTQLIVNLESSIPESPPVLKFSTQSLGPEALTFKRNSVARLECFFSGYVNKVYDEVPTITWQDNAGSNIISGQGRFTIERHGRVLVIENLVEADEKSYTCTAKNKLNSAKRTMMLNVTSPPIWVKPLQFVTVPQGQDAVFHCQARSAASEIPPGQPRWLKNGNSLAYEPEKYTFTDEKRVLTVRSAQKSTDIACFQCYVSNSVGEEFGNGCLNVILPIQIVTQPKAVQVVERGDVVDLTLVATSDRLYPLSYRWIFHNHTYELDQAPPHVFYDFTSKMAYINTTHLTDEQMRSIRGVYRREVYHQFQMEVVDVEVRLKGDPDTVPVAEAGFDFWIIGVVIAILLLLAIVFVVVCVLCHRKMQEGAYPVDKKETAAGLDPEKELKESGFHDLSLADCDELYPEEMKASVLDIHNIPCGERDDESFGSAEYYAEQTAFNEDGSFIGVYHSRGSEESAPPTYQPAIESDV